MRITDARYSAPVLLGERFFTRLTLLRTRRLRDSLHLRLAYRMWKLAADGSEIETYRSQQDAIFFPAHEHRWIKPAERRLHRRVAAAVEDVAVGDGDAVEVPLQDALEGRLRGDTVAHAEADDAVRPEAARLDQPEKEAGAAGHRAGDVEGEVGEQQGAGRRVEEHHLVHDRRTAEDVLLELARPLRRRLVVEHRAERARRPASSPDPGAA